MFDIQSSLLLKTIILRIIFFYLQDLIPPPCFFVVVEIAELREIQSSTFTPPPLFFSEIQTSRIFFGWDRDPWYLTSTPFFWLRYRPSVFNPCFFFGAEIYTPLGWEPPSHQPSPSTSGSCDQTLPGSGDILPEMTTGC